MSKFEVDITKESETAANNAPLADYKPMRGRGRKVFAIFAVLVACTVLVVAVAGLVYWTYLKTTPQYSVALIVDAARRDDQKAIEELVDTDAIVDDFVPQITDKAVELYGRGLAPDLVKQVSVIAAPVMPFVKEKARAELPKLLRERTKKFEKIPFWLMAAGASRYLDVKIVNGTAKVKSKSKDRPLEITMKREEGRWKIVAVKDEALAKRVAERVGQQIIALVKDNGSGALDRVGEKIGLKNLGDLIRKAEEIFE